jgi:hypothetical protein
MTDYSVHFVQYMLLAQYNPINRVGGSVITSRIVKSESYRKRDLSARTAK